MRKILKNNTKTRKYLETLPKIYAITLRARWRIEKYYFSGKFKTEDNIYIPLVYNYNDHNGITDQWELIRLNYATWTFQEKVAKDLVEYYNTKENYKNYKRMMEEADEIEFSQKS